MTFAKHDPRRVVDFSIVLDGNATADPIAPAPAMKNPDNLGISSDSLMIQEDVSSGFGSRILRYDLNAGALSVVACVNAIGSESSGIVNASAFFGDGCWTYRHIPTSSTRRRWETSPSNGKADAHPAHGRGQLDIGAGSMASPAPPPGRVRP